MATAESMKKVTEAYIGLFGRAPDPAGLDYWAQQLDAEVAAGKDADIALKELTAGMTANAEWTEDGLGQAGTTSAQIVTAMFNNLFGKGPSAADLEYWTKDLDDGVATPSEMVVLLIQGAQQNSTTEAEILEFKQEAASYYAAELLAVAGDPDPDTGYYTNPPQYSLATAADSVAGVDGPASRDASKEKTDALASGEGSEIVLTEGKVDTVAMTLGNDTVTGTVGDGNTYDGESISDNNTADSDVLNLSGDDGIIFGVTKNVETINISLAATKSAGFVIDADKLTGGDVSLDVAPVVDVVGVEVAGETVVDLDNFAGNLATTEVTAIDVDLKSAASQTFSFDAKMASLTLGAVDSNDTTVMFANNDVAMTVTGTAADNDAMSVSVNTEASITFDTERVEDITVTANNGAAEVTIAGAAAADPADVSYTIAGDNDVTLVGDAEQFDAAQFSNSGSGAAGLKLTAGSVAAVALDNFGVLGGGIELAEAGGNFELLVASGNTVTNSKAGADLALDANDTAKDSSITIDLAASAGNITTVGYETVTITTNDAAEISAGAIELDGAVATIGGDNDVSVGTVTDFDTISIVGLDVTTGALGSKVGDANDVTIVATNDATVGNIAVSGDVSITATVDDLSAAAIEADNDVTLTAGDAIAVSSSINIVKGTLDITGDDIEVDGAIDVVTGAITMMATNDVILNDTVDASNDITLSGDGLQVNSDLTSDKGGIELTATNEVSLGGSVDAETSVTVTADDLMGAVFITANNDISITVTNDIDMAGGGTITSAKDDVMITAKEINLSAITALEGTVTIDANDTVMSAIDVIEAEDVVVTSGNVDVSATLDATDMLTVAGDADLTAGTVTAGAITVTTTNDVNFTNTDTDLVVVATAADVDLGVVTFAADDALADPDETTIAITTGSGNDGMDLSDGNVFTVSTGLGKDTVVITETGTGSVVNTGGGDDTVTLDVTGQATVVTGDGDDKISLSAGFTGSVDAGNDTDTLTLFGGEDLTSSAVVKNIEEIFVTGPGGLTVSEAQLDNDSTFKLTGDDAEIFATGVKSVDLSGVTFGAGNSSYFNLEANDDGSNIIGAVC